MKKPIHPELRDAVHAYTRSKSPWIMGEYKSNYGKLIHYLSGGGMRVFGRTTGQEEAKIRQTRFLVVAGVLATVWLVLLVF